MRVLVTHHQSPVGITLLGEDGTVWEAETPPPPFPCFACVPVIGTVLNKPQAESQYDVIKQSGLIHIQHQGKLPPDAAKLVWDQLTGVEKPC